ncbi:MAG: hypothetical protein AB7E28_06860 [Desulfurella sp.]|jgi:hypothetical protein
MKSNYIIIYVPFLIILVGMGWPINQKPYNISIPQNLSNIENLNIQSIEPAKQINIEPEEVFLLNKSALAQNNATVEFSMPQLTIISKDKSGYFCFLNGRFYRSGDSGEDFKVLKIGSDYVILQTPIGRQTLYVKIP